MTSSPPTLHISWLFLNNSLKSLKSASSSIDMHHSQEKNSKESFQDIHTMMHANVGLCGCPGRKIKSKTPGSSDKFFDLNQDICRLQSLGVKTIVCCLNDYDLRHIGVQFKTYSRMANECGIEILRIPIIEGSVPVSIEAIEPILSLLEEKLQSGHAIIHCKAGMGRAGLVAACFLLKKGYCQTAKEAIQFVRSKRSTKAIETKRQEDFIQEYCAWISESRRMQ